MTIFQAILLLFVLSLFILYLRFSKNQALKRLGLVVVFSTGVLFIIFPHLTTKIANLFGVGRGADLIFYCNIIVVYLIIINLYSKNRKLNKDITKIVRDNAIKETKNNSLNHE